MTGDEAFSPEPGSGQDGSSGGRGPPAAKTPRQPHQTPTDESGPFPIPEATHPDENEGMRNTTKLYVAVTGVVIVAALVVALQPDRPLDLPAGSPEAVVAEYVETIIADGDPSHLLTSAAAKECDDRGFYHQDIQRVRISSIDTQDSRSVVEVEITWTNGDEPFGSDWTSEDRFILTGGAGKWMIDEVPWNLCEGR